MSSATAPMAVTGLHTSIPPQTTKISHDEWIARARQIGPLIRAEALNTEQGNTLSPASIAAMRDTGLFWAAVPVEVGGFGCRLVTAIQIMEEVAFADGSSGWSLMANKLATAVAGAFAGDDAVQEIFGGSELPILAGMFGPGGKVEAVDGGYRGSGKFSFGSGCGHADWIGGGMFLMENGANKLLPNGAPQVRVCFVPRDKVVFTGNWDVTGLSGTGSFDYEITDQFVPSDFTMERTELKPQRGGPVFDLGLQAFGCAGHAAMALGIARRALQEIALISTSKKRVASSLLISESPIFRYGFSEYEANYQAMRAYVLKVFDDAERLAESGQPVPAKERQRLRQATAWSHNTAADIVDFCHLWGGSASIRKPTALGRCLQDMHVATQHIFVDQHILADVAPTLLEHWAGLDA
ncbi:MAG: hsaA [Sphingomonadales bacterium]|nr:hsaA [Sphingomonadales bacterium]